MAPRCRISVVIPTYGRDTALRRAVCSALDQTLAPVEVIVVDDGSAQPIARHFLPDDRRIRLLRLDVNSGPAAARNAGIAASHGDWIAFLDSDDFWYPEKLARQWRQAEIVDDRLETVFVTGWAKIRKEKTLSLVVPREAKGLRQFAMGCWFSPGSTAFLHRQLFDRVGLFDAGLRRLEDYDWYLRFGRLGGQIRVDQQALIGLTWHVAEAAPSFAHAARRVWQRYLDPASPDYVDAAAARRSMRAYLYLTQASVLWYAGRKFPSLVLLLQSFLANPRLSLQNDKLHEIISEEARDPFSQDDGYRLPV